MKPETELAQAGTLQKAEDLQAMRATAYAISATDLVPKQFRGKPDAILAAALYGQELGFGIMTSLQNIVVIKGTPALAARGMGSLVRRAGHSLTWTVTDSMAKVSGRRRDTGDVGEVTFTMDDAKNAELLDSTAWRKYPKPMLFNRAVSQLCRQLFQDIFAGIAYTPEEAASFTSVQTPRMEALEQPSAKRDLSKLYMEHGMQPEEMVGWANDVGFPIKGIKEIGQLPPHAIEEILELAKEKYVERDADADLDGGGDGESDLPEHPGDAEEAVIVEDAVETELAIEDENDPERPFV